MRISRIFVGLVLIIFMSSCTQVVKNTADEIRLNTWSARLKSESMVTLKFKEDIASFKVTSSDKKPDLKLSGLCIIDSKNIMIFDDSDNQNYVFSYKLKENKLILGYNSGKLTLKRK